ncbi:Predicted nucleic acid-binding protein, contains Zn-ribbon domain (includes truncated derivatives) [Nocardioides terrae]|uniref:Predicted nucleic acid-binding protein, contains Zn-ribbon domain (Includes truncated derivatives) n=1 Tax=Nocardioides terrae TaxID=574651 RepID=A0A1I1N920_9ACTN|nr:DciA family protein [Nocardioides terrae]SFC91263.1 Predicted nucleic acid-binding protein, contains Zn-ribbon domain (includes truncated derivatives) [Nocardioides terrae]
MSDDSGAPDRPPDRAPDLSNGDTPPEGPDGQTPEVPAPDGLDLARALMRATAGSSTRKATKRSKKRRDGGARGRVSGSHPDDRDPQLLDATLGRLVADHGWELDLRVHGVFGRWAELVGVEIADHCTPESFADGRLVVRTDSTAWATQLRLLAPTVVRRLNEELGHGTVTVIEVLGPHLPTWKKGRLSSRDGRGPRDTYG